MVFIFDNIIARFDTLQSKIRIFLYRTTDINGICTKNASAKQAKTPIVYGDFEIYYLVKFNIDNVYVLNSEIYKCVCPVA